MAADDKAKRRLGLGVSTKLENAWYVKPDLLAGEEEGQAPPPVSDDDDFAPQDSTVALGLNELEEAAGELGEEDEDARHYQQVSLKGALLAPDEDPSVVQPAPRPRPTPRRQSPAGGGIVGDMVATLVREVPALFVGLARELPHILEPGRVSPVFLALVAFFLGVGLTLLGVLIAL